MIVRVCTQLARRLLGMDNSGSVWLSRACHGTDNSRGPHSVCESAETTALSLVRDSPVYQAPQDFWPGNKAPKNRPAAACDAAEPRGEPSEVLSDKVAVLDSDPAPHASERESAQPGPSPPKSVEERVRGAAEASHPPGEWGVEGGWLLLPDPCL